MSTQFSFPEMSPAEIAHALNHHVLAEGEELRPEDIAAPRPDLLQYVLARFLDVILGEEDGDRQLGFEALQGLDHPEHYQRGLLLSALYHRARRVLEAIQFRGFTFRDLLRPEPRRVSHILSAIVNYLHFRQDKIALLEAIVDDLPSTDELNDKIAEHSKAIADYEDKMQKDETVIQQLKASNNALKQKIQDYIKQQQALKAKAKAIEDKREEVLNKISQADFDLIKKSEENSKLSAKVVQSPEKLQVHLRKEIFRFQKYFRALVEKKSARAELKNLEKMSTLNVQEKETNLEMYTKAYEKLSKLSSSISCFQEQMAAAKTVEKEAKAVKTKISNQNSEMIVLDAKYVEWERKVSEAEERLKAKEKEKEQRIADNEQKLATLKSEVEWKLQCLAIRKSKVEEKLNKATDLCSQADAIELVAKVKQEKLIRLHDEILDAIEPRMDYYDSLPGAS
ncbi:hypothetical protein ACP4OV_003851 [Aristida adscensionis]